MRDRMVFDHKGNFVRIIDCLQSLEEELVLHYHSCCELHCVATLE